MLAQIPSSKNHAGPFSGSQHLGHPTLIPKRRRRISRPIPGTQTQTQTPPPKPIPTVDKGPVQNASSHDRVPSLPNKPKEGLRIIKNDHVRPFNADSGDNAAKQTVGGVSRDDADAVVGLGHGGNQSAVCVERKVAGVHTAEGLGLEMRELPSVFLDGKGNERVGCDHGCVGGIRIGALKAPLESGGDDDEVGVGLGNMLAIMFSKGEVGL